MSAELIKAPVDASGVLRKASSENKWDFNAEAAKLLKFLLHPTSPAMTSKLNPNQP